MCTDFLYNICLKNLILRRIQRQTVTNVPRSSHAKFPSFLSDINTTSIFSIHFGEKPEYQIPSKFVE